MSVAGRANLGCGASGGTGAEGEEGVDAAAVGLCLPQRHGEKEMELVAQPVYVEHWAPHAATSTLGKREKDVRVEPNTGKLFYYKHSDKRYPWDFWCEVIASKLGQLLGLDIAHYEPAYTKDVQGHYVWGCLSKLLHDPKQGEEFVHGQSYLQLLKPDFETERGVDHDYELIQKALILASAHEQDTLKFHEMLVFDALICNRDRHQENWALIRSRAKVRHGERTPGQGDEGLLGDLLAFALSSLQARLAPIYDSGTSLGHNLLEAKMAQMLAEPSGRALLNFATGPKSTAHIRWQGERLRHDALLLNIGRSAPALLLPALTKVTEAFDRLRVAEMLEVIDAKAVREERRDLIPVAYMLNPVRKDFIRELLYLRHRELCKLREQISGSLSGST